MNKQGVFSPQKSNNKYTQSPPAQLLYSTTLLFGFYFFPYLSHSHFPLFISTHLPHSSLFSSRLLPFSWCFSTLSFMCIFFAAHFLRYWLHNFLFFPFPLHSPTVPHRYPGRQTTGVSGILWLRAALVQDTWNEMCIDVATKQKL